MTGGTVRLRLPDGAEFEGPIVDLRGVDADVSPAAILAAIRAGCPTRPDRPTVYAPPPTRVHTHVCRLSPEIPLDRRAALAAVGAARGVETTSDADLAAAKRSLRDLSVPTVDDAELRAARRRAAEAGSETERLRERVATLRGRVAARRVDGDDDAVAEAETALSEATRELSEASTEEVAATQRLATLERRADRSRDAREKRLRLEDRIANRRRARRAAHADAVEPDFRDARGRIGSALGGRFGTCGDDAGTPLRDALAVAAVAPIRAPVVVDPDVVSALGGPEATFERLDAPLVIR
ncbi:DUF7856 family protein [Halobellus ruber]|uniref:Uncharacterized protein n=1 Tax=Halobellus ruber TaxID=2761102 RepID=A0A7J9SL79_9EURY|nr:hypothetical protein [Halobellus ruber]MBB6647458.1 hypothetical protein [Halobellus ruber]